MITVEQLFEEDFKPVWMQREEASIRQSIIDAQSVQVDWHWKMNALDTVAKLSNRFPPKLPLPRYYKKSI